MESPEPPNKQERYFTGMPVQQDPSKPLPGEMPPSTKASIIRLALGVGLLGLGLVGGLAFGPEAPQEAQERIAELEQDLVRARTQIQELNRALKYKGNEMAGSAGGALAPLIKQKQLEASRRYAAAIRAQNAQSASELIVWFAERWNDLLDRPEPEDLYERRARLLSQVIGGMRNNLDPGDYAPWQAEFLAGNWLGRKDYSIADLHYDLDGDGFPTKRKNRNPKRAFHDRSVCEIAMVLNQWTNNAQVLMQPGMQCDSPTVRLSMLLQGPTIDDAINEFIGVVKSAGLVVVDKNFKGTRMVLVAPGRR